MITFNDSDRYGPAGRATAYYQNQDQYNLAQMFNQNQLASEMQKLQETIANAPLERSLKEADLAGKQANTAQTQARTTGLEQENKFNDQTYQSRLDAFLSGNKGKISKQQADEITNAGQAYGQAAGILATLPVAARHAAAKRILGPLYQPEFDNIQPQDLEDALRQSSNWMAQASQKYVQALDLQRQRDLSAEERTRIKAEADQKQEEIKAAARLAVEKWKSAQGGKPSKESYQQAIRRLMEEVIPNLPPGEERDKQIAILTELRKVAYEDIIARTQAGQAGQPSLGGAGIPVNPPAQPSPITLPAPAASGASAPAPAASAPAPTAKPITATNPKTGEQIQSLDGGKTWQPIKK